MMTVAVEGDGWKGTERFSILRRLGAGGMGVVYLAHDRESDRQVALKTLRGHSPRALALFKREFRALSRITHPNLVGLYELGRDEHQFFYTMELVRGSALLKYLWGSEPAGWSDDLTGWQRLRVIVNAMTRMRFCTLDGVMEFKVKGKLSNAPAGHLPWFDLPGRQSADSVLVTGHWSALGLKVTPNLLALDSGCLWGGHLTAVRLEDRQVFQVDCSPTEALPLKR